MKRIFKNKFIACIIATAITLLAAVCAVFAIPKTVSVNADETGNYITNIYVDKEKKFRKERLNDIAAAFGYDDMKALLDMIKNVPAAERNDFAKTSAELSEEYLQIEFGTYQFKNVTTSGTKESDHTLVWTPTYLSIDNNGNAILTLWLDSVEASNGTVSNQERRQFSQKNGGSATKTQEYNGINVVTMNYDGSFMRHYVLNGDDDYLTWTKTVNGDSITAIPDKESMTKFSRFVGEGDLSRFLDTPSQLQWQMMENANGNDPAFTGTNSQYYTAEWVNDTLWLPSKSEVWPTDSIWNTSVEQRKSKTITWTRSAQVSHPNSGMVALAKGGGAAGVNDAYSDNARGVRPCIHLNLNAAFGGSGSHTHVFEDYKPNNDATCTKDGTETSACYEKTCQVTDTRDIAGSKLGHAFAEEFTVDSEATCTKAGSKSKHCTRDGCNGKGEVTEIEALGHSWSEEGETVSQATCTQKGKVKYTCTRDGCTGSETEDTDALGHQFGDWETVKEATCTENGSKKRVCTRDGCTGSETESIDSLGHEFSKDFTDDTAPTCTTAGSKSKHCTRAGCTGKSDVTAIEALGHNFSITVSGTQPTCQKGGTATMKCSRCEETQVQDSADPVDHVYTNYVSDGNATCTKNGTKTAECDFGCGTTDTVEDEDSATGHSFTEYESDDNATCLEDGTKTATCDNGCGATDTIDDEGSATGHSFTEYESDDNATCINDGTKTATCDNGCGATDTIDDEGSATGHSFTEYESDDNATCTEDGTKTAQCSRGCGATDTIDDEDSALGHDFAEYISDNNATCTDDGTKTAQCDYGCGTDDTITDAGSALGHNYAWVITKEATVEESGLMENLCTRCDDKDGEEEIAKLVDPNGEIDLPVDINVEFKVTQSSTDNDYPDIYKGIKRGYWAQLWYREEDGTLGEEFTDKINCFITLKIPTEVIEAIRGGDEINRDKIAEGLTVYYYVDGERYEVENFKISQKEDESWQIKFNYNEKFRAEVVFAADKAESDEEPAAGIPWWVWLIVGLVAVAIVGVVIIIIVVIKKKNGSDGGTTVVQGTQYDDAELKAQLAKQDEKIDRLIEITDGGFNDVVDGE